MSREALERSPWDDDEEGEEEEEEEAAVLQPTSGLTPVTASELTDTFLAGGTSYEALQVAELLRDNTSRSSVVAALSAAVDALRATLAALPSVTVPFGAAAKRLAALQAPADTSLSWSPPSAVTLVGGAAWGACPPPSDEPAGGGCAPHSLPEVALQLPSRCLRDKDYLDRRVAAKSVLFLQHCLEALPGARWEHPPAAPPTEDATALEEAALRPTLLLPLTLGAPWSGRLLVRLTMSLPADAFPASKLAPERRNLRACAAPSPHYSASLVEAMEAEAEGAHHRSLALSVPALPAVAALLHLWARRRSLLARVRAAGGDAAVERTLGALTCALAGRGVLQPAMAPHQALRAALRALGPGALLSKLSSATGAAAALRGSPGAPVLQSLSGQRNVLRLLSRGEAEELEAEAALSCAALDAAVASQGPKGAPAARSVWDAALLRDAPHSSRYDLHLRLLLSGDMRGSAAEAACEDLVRRALGPRALRCLALLDAAAAEPGLLRVTVHVKLCADAAVAQAVLDAGPTAEDAAACRAFRSFWGDRSTLRRFPDGSISEAVVWDEGGVAAQHTIPARAALFALQRNLPAAGLQLRRACSSAGCLDGALPSGAAPVTLMQSLDRLWQRIRGLDALPLKPSALQPLSPAFRGTDAAPPEPHPLLGGPAAASGVRVPAVVAPLEVALSLEGSGSWPRAPVARRKTAAAYLLAVAAGLGRSFGLNCSASEQDVDIFFEGYAWRLRLLDEEGEEGGEAAAASPQAPPLRRRLSHAAALSALCAHHASLGPTCRLAKRWRCAQLLSGVLGDEAVELLCAAAYAHPRALAAPPTTREAGLLAFLQLLAELRSGGDGAVLAVDVSGDWGAAGWSALRDEAQRAAAAAAPSATLLLPSPLDAGGALWAPPSHPCPATLLRAQRLAATCARRLSAALRLGGGEAEAGASGSPLLSLLFRPSFEGFDLVVRLRRSALPHLASRALPDEPKAAGEEAPRVLARAPGPPPPGSAAAALQPPPLRLAALPPALLARGQEGAGRAAMLVGFEPRAMLASVLRRRFGHLALFLVDAHGGDALLVALRPAAVAVTPPPLRLSRLACCSPGEGGGMQLNVAELATEIQALGNGLVARVEARGPAELKPAGTGERKRRAAGRIAASKAQPKRARSKNAA